MKSSMFVVLIFTALLAGCSSTQVQRVDRNKPLDYSGDWNDFDAKIASEELIKDCLAGAWIDRFMKESGRNPRIIVGNVLNRSHNHVDTMILTKSLEKAVLDSGKATFVASKDERGGIREEKEDQQSSGWSDPSTVAQKGKELGADYMLIGSVNSIVDSADRQSWVINQKNNSAVFFQVNMELVKLDTNEKVWIGQKEIKKAVTRSKIGF